MELTILKASMKFRFYIHGLMSLSHLLELQPPHHIKNKTKYQDLTWTVDLENLYPQLLQLSFPFF